MDTFKNVLLAVAIVALIFFLFDLFAKFLARKVVTNSLSKKIVKLDDNKLKKRYASAKTYAGIAGYVIVFIFTGLFVFSFMRIPKAQFKCYEAEMIKRGLPL